MRKKWLEILVNIFFWVATTWLFLSTFSIISKNIQIVNGKEVVSLFYNRQLSLQLVTCILFSACLFYSNLWLFLKYQDRKGKNTLVLKTALLFIVTVLFYYLLQKIIRPVPALMPGVIVGIFIFYFTISITYATAKLWLRTITHNKILRLEKKKLNCRC